VTPSNASRIARELPAQDADSWVLGLGKVFKRVALFRLQGTDAKLCAAHGIGLPPLGTTLSLLDPSPLRWAVEAASPIVGAGAAPGGGVIALALGVTAPRAYAIIPMVVNGRLDALAYVDQTREPLPLSAAAELFAFADRVLKGPVATQPANVVRLGCRSTARRRLRALRCPTLLPATLSRTSELPTEPPSVAPITPSTPPTPQSPPPAAQSPTLPPPLPRRFVAITPESLEPAPTSAPVPAAPPIAAAAAQDALVKAVLDDVAKEIHAEDDPVWVRRVKRTLLTTARYAAAILLGTLVAGAAALWPMAPPADSEPGDITVQIPKNVGLPQIAVQLYDQHLIKNPTVFAWLARLSGADRELKAGVYRLPTGEWAWSVLAELYHGQVHTRTITFPEGLTLTDVAGLLEAHGLARATDILREANDPALLTRLGVPGTSLEGFLFPESYTLSLGLSAAEILTVMHQEFRTRLGALPGANTLSPELLLAKVTLASIVEREVRNPEELARVAGVFHNRLNQGMRLESCATVQYILGKPKARLTLQDVRIDSPYNTYLHEGLPPGPIANPGIKSLAAVMAPEQHDYLFFFARPDGSRTHIFSKSFAEHQKLQKLQTQEKK